VAGARAVEQREARHHAVPPGRGEPGGLLLGGQRGADDDRDVLAYVRLLRGRLAFRVDERDGRPDIRLDLGGQCRVDQDGRGPGAQPVVFPPRFGLPHLLQRLDPRGQMEHRVHAAHRRTHGGRIERVEFGPARGAHLVPPALGQRQERSSENTGPSGYEQTHGSRFLSVSASLAALAMTSSACVGAGRTDIGQLADVAGGRPGHDERVEVRIVLDALDPPAGIIRVSGDDPELRFTGWLGLLRVLYQVMGSPAGPQAAAPPDTEES
jgi:hypothetical protein